MIPVLSRAERRAFDAHAIDVWRVPSLLLMENAGRGATDVVVREIFVGKSPANKRIIVVCGAGNNGGDGLVVARHFLTRGAHVDVRLVGDRAKLTVDCRANLEAFEGVGGLVRGFFEAPLEADLVVDAIFGTGLARDIGEPFVEIIAGINRVLCPKVALDLPSGIDADRGVVLGCAVTADMTVTFGHSLLGHMTGHGARITGPVHVVDLGVPGLPEARASVVQSEARDVRRHVHTRALDTHKYRAGHVALVAGSHGKIGAALLAAHGALRGGAGAATIVTWPLAARAVESRVVEVMTRAIGREDTPGEGWAAEVDAALVHTRAVVMGPGFGTDRRASEIMRHIVATYPGQLVVDADALTIHAGAVADLSVASGRAVLTPHAGELARLLGTSSDAVERDRFAAVRAAAAASKCVVVLKGAYTLIAEPGGRVVVNTTGNPALATAGSGDVLAGVIGALVTTLPPFEAAWCGVYLHGAAGDAWASAHADRGLLASEIADEIPGALRRLAASDA